ncbi:MAG: aspartate aminotransferase family protein [Gammaproteobacteria bacterium]|nr:aspartate aminotransferase family protein [Gammaproteobacteria bacterium]
MDTSKSVMTDLPDLQAYWMPFTANRQFKSDPRFVVDAQGMYYTSHDGQQLLDGVSGLWCCNAGHCHPHIVAAIQEQAAKLDYYTAFQMGYPRTFELANRLAEMAPEGLTSVFFTNSGSESVDTALKIALAWHRVRGEGQRVRLIGRQKGYHGVGFGGISVGGISSNRKLFGALLAGVDHLGHTQDLEHQAFSRGQPEWGAHLADELEEIVALHDASTIAAVIIEPIACSGGVLVPPKGYLERIREICDEHGLLLIFDEVITGFGRTGEAFASQTFGVTPDIITLAKGLTSGAVPMGAVLARRDIYEDFMQGPEQLIEFAHGYTYSGHPLAVAAAHASLDVYQDQGLFERGKETGKLLGDALQALKDKPYVIDIRDFGMLGAVELEPVPDKPTARAQEAFRLCFDNGLLVRTTGDTIALCPALVAEESHIAELVDKLARVLDSLS